MNAMVSTIGAHAREIEELWWLYVGLLTAVYVVVIAWFGAAVLKGRRAGVTPMLKADSMPPPQWLLRKVEPLDAHRESVIARVVVIASGVTLAMLFIFLIWSVAAGRSLAALNDADDAIEIEITGYRYWWAVRYPHPDPTQIVTTANEIHIPVGEPVKLTLRSADVIHSFWVPALHGKTDLIPGRTTSMVLRVDRPGVYRGQCAEFCGPSHAKMGIVVVAESKERFASWIKHALEPAAMPFGEKAQRGQRVFMNGPCALCHTIGGTPAQGKTAPDLTHFASRGTIAAGTLPNVRGHLAGWILNPQSIKPGAGMPNMSLDADDLHALLAYLESLK